MNTLDEALAKYDVLVSVGPQFGQHKDDSITGSEIIDGWPDHGVPEPYQMRGGAYFDPDPRYYKNTFMADYRSKDPEFEGRDILKMVIPAAHARGMKVFVELMEPFGDDIARVYG